MNPSNDYPDDFRKCVEFHGHICPGLAIGYSAVKAADGLMKTTASEDEELVCLVENNSCAVDAVQVLLGCTFGKGNLIFRDWGKQVFTFFDRHSGRAVRASLKQSSPHRELQHELRKKINLGTATEEDKKRFTQLREDYTKSLISEPQSYFEVKEIEMEAPPQAQIVDTAPCAICGEETMVSRMTKIKGSVICKDCAK
ncbi:MAG: FmdE family protein [Pseudomonadota bacterium]